MTRKNCSIGSQGTVLGACSSIVGKVAAMKGIEHTLIVIAYNRARVVAYIRSIVENAATGIMR